MCEFCSPVPGAGCICELGRWADDGGPVFDHDGDTLPAETLPEVAALTRTDLRPVTRTWHAAALQWVAFGVWAGWAGLLVWFFGFVYRR
jgi:hypothetical protein